MLAVAGLGRDKWECRGDQKECSHHTSNDSHMDCGLENGLLVRVLRKQGRCEPDETLGLSRRFIPEESTLNIHS